MNIKTITRDLELLGNDFRIRNLKLIPNDFHTRNLEVLRNDFSNKLFRTTFK